MISLPRETYLPSLAANPLASAPRLLVPLLILGSRHDRHLPVKDALTLLRRAATKDKHRLLPGWVWGIADTTPYAASARALILGWIKGRS